MKDNHYKIGYLAKSESARLVLTRLLHEDEVNYQYLTELADDTTIRTLVDFGFIEQSNKVSYGFTRETALISSTYRITDFGANFITNYETLFNTSVSDTVAQLSSGDFTRFRDALVTFQTSEYSLEVRESYEFIFGIGSKSSNFYNVRKNKLVTIYRKMYELKRFIFKVVTYKSYKQVLKKYCSQITEFALIAKEITDVLAKDGKSIETSLQFFLDENDKGSDFFEKKALQVFGTNIVDLSESEETLKKVVTSFSEEVLGVSTDGLDMISTYVALLRRVVKLATDLGVQLDNLNSQMQMKAECMRLADEVASCDSTQTAQLLFSHIISNRGLTYVSQNDFATFKGSTLYVKPKEIKERKVKSEDLTVDYNALKLVQLKDTLTELSAELNTLEKVANIARGSSDFNNLDSDSYALISDSLLNVDLDKSAVGEFSLNPSVSSSSEDFTIRTYVETVGKFKKKTYKNRKVQFHVRGDITKEIEKVQGRIHRLTSEIAERQPDR